MWEGFARKGKQVDRKSVKERVNLKNRMSQRWTNDSWKRGRQQKIRVEIERWKWWTREGKREWVKRNLNLDGWKSRTQDQKLNKNENQFDG